MYCIRPSDIHKMFIIAACLGHCHCLLVTAGFRQVGAPSAHSTCCWRVRESPRFDDTDWQWRYRSNVYMYVYIYYDICIYIYYIFVPYDIHHENVLNEPGFFKSISWCFSRHGKCALFGSSTMTHTLSFLSLTHFRSLSRAVSPCLSRCCSCGVRELSEVQNLNHSDLDSELWEAQSLNHSDHRTVQVLCVNPDEQGC
jgi:hypothetical protein